MDFFQIFFRNCSNKKINYNILGIFPSLGKILKIKEKGFIKNRSVNRRINNKLKQKTEEQKSWINKIFKELPGQNCWFLGKFYLKMS